MEKLERIERLAKQYLEILPKTMSGFVAEALNLPLEAHTAEANEQASTLLSQLAAALDEAEGEDVVVR